MLLQQVARGGAGALIRTGRRWAAASRRAALAQLRWTAAALELSDAALAGESLPRLAERVAHLSRALSGARSALVYGEGANGPELLGADPPSAATESDGALAAQAMALENRVEDHQGTLEPRRPVGRVLALPLSRAGESSRALVLHLPAGVRAADLRGMRALLERAGAALASADRQAGKDRFLSFAAHELKTPLTSIKGFAYSLARRVERGDSADPRAIAVLERQAERLHGLLEEMLEVSRLETGRFLLHQEPCDLGEVLMAVERALRRLGLGGTALGKPADPLPLLADRERLERALVALVQRARFLGEPVSLEASRLGDRARVRVAWTGESLGERDRAHAFGPRWEDPEGERQGLGMALMVAERAVLLHGGRLSCEATAFILELPVQASGEVRANGSGDRVLVVDDDEPLARMLAEFLSESGFRTDWAAGGRAALAKMHADGAPDLLVLDLGMPDLDGRALLLRARAELSRQPRVVLLSADRAVAQAARELGARSFVEKPFAPEGLLLAIRKALG